MIRVAQHQSDRSLFDIREVVKELSAIHPVDSWQYEIESCVWRNGSDVPEDVYKPAKTSHAEFCRIFDNVSQTIDGIFRAFFGNELIGTFEAVDSSYWEIDAIPSVEAHFKWRCEAYASVLPQK